MPILVHSWRYLSYIDSPKDNYSSVSFVIVKLIIKKKYGKVSKYSNQSKIWCFKRRILCTCVHSKLCLLQQEINSAAKNKLAQPVGWGDFLQSRKSWVEVLSVIVYV